MPARETIPDVSVTYGANPYRIGEVMRTMILLASACLAGGTVEAQATGERRVRTADEARRVAETVVWQDGHMKRTMVDDSAAMNRATLGVTLGGAANKRDTLGVFVEAVAEDGPAERAGIYEGNRIAFINNVDVRASSADAGDAYLSSVGMHRLVRAMRDVSAGSTVTLRVWTGSGYRDVQLTAGRFSDVYKNQRFGMFERHGFPGSMSFGPGMERVRIEGPMMRHLKMHPGDSHPKVVVPAQPGHPELRRAPAPRSPRAPRAGTPSANVVPSVRAVPRVISIPRVAPTSDRTRRYTI